MTQEKNYTKEELEDAYEEGGRTIGGGARILGCDWKTFKKYWERLESTPRDSQPQEVSYKQQSLNTYTDDDYADPNVRELVENYRAVKNDTESTLKHVVYEIVDKIDHAKVQVKRLNEQIEKMEKYLKNMEMEE